MIRAHPQMVDTYVHLKGMLLTDDRSSRIESEDHRPRAGSFKDNRISAPRALALIAEAKEEYKTLSKEEKKKFILLAKKLPIVKAQGPKTVKCYRCGEIGHMVSTCASDNPLPSFVDRRVSQAKPSASSSPSAPPRPRVSLMASGSEITMPDHFVDYR
jgi:hypothetical protein